MTLTNAGRNLLAKALTGKTLTFTHAAVGNGDLGNRSISAMTGLVSQKLTLPVTAMKTSSVGTAEVTVEISNSELTTGFFLKEYGLFAKDPDNSNNTVLYSYCNKGNEAGYLEGFDGTNPVHFALSLITVIDQAQNITANITVSNNYVTQTVLDSRIESLFAQQGNTAGFWTYEANDTRRFRPLPLTDTRKLILGVDDTASLQDRLKAAENAINQIALALNVQEIEPGADRFIAEDFIDPDSIDLYAATVTSVVAGDDSIDCNPIGGMIPGGVYTLTDGVKSENVQAESINLENGIMRVILYNTVRNTYNLETCRLLRSTADIKNGNAFSSSVNRNIVWIPGITWKGLASSASYTIPLDTTISAAGNFSLSGNASIDSDGCISLSFR